MLDSGLDRLFSALAEPTRRRVVELLRDGPRRAGHLAEASHVSAPVMSRHLRVLLEAGIVDDERSPVDARVRLFFLRKESIGALQSWLDSQEPVLADVLGPADSPT
jgi:DNA-binding transcriptional ArsR family regulator